MTDPLTSPFASFSKLKSPKSVWPATTSSNPFPSNIVYGPAGKLTLPWLTATPSLLIFFTLLIFNFMSPDKLTWGALTLTLPEASSATPLGIDSRVPDPPLNVTKLLAPSPKDASTLVKPNSNESSLSLPALANRRTEKFALTFCPATSIAIGVSNPLIS